MSAATLTRQERKRRKSARARERKAKRCNLTPDEKRARRDAHAEMLGAVYEWLATPEGAADWLEGLELNAPDAVAGDYRRAAEIVRELEVVGIERSRLAWGE